MKRNKYSLTNYKLFSGDMGKLMPINLTEVLPGDTIQQATSALIRVSPLVSPVMHPVHVRIHHFFVPHRLIWDDFEKFITGGDYGSTPPVFPTTTVNVIEGDIWDYLGLPVGCTEEVSVLPLRAYNLIWNEFYRDQDLQTELAISRASGNDITTDILLSEVCWEKDYFTSARPWSQKTTDIVLPLGTTAPVVSDGTMPTMTNGTDTRNWTTTNGTPASVWNANGSLTGDMTDWVNTGMEADLSGATAATINQLREAFALQRYAEARARYGSRYTEYLAYLGVKASDARLTRPEYLGGGKQTIQFSEVLQTGVDSSDEGVGNLKGHGIGALRTNRYRKYFEEHGYIMTLMSVLPKTIYAQGIPRTWNRRTKEDFHQKELELIGQQEILNKELKHDHATPDGVFGYQDRYDEYRRQESTIAGEFAGTLDYWHMARIFASDPTLNADFVKANPTKRIHAVQTEHVLWVMANNSIQARRNIGRIR